jgi:hypothetical protein
MSEATLFRTVLIGISFLVSLVRFPYADYIHAGPTGLGGTFATFAPFCKNRFSTIRVFRIFRG